VRIVNTDLEIIIFFSAHVLTNHKVIKKGQATSRKYTLVGPTYQDKDTIEIIVIVATMKKGLTKYFIIKTPPNTNSKKRSQLINEEHKREPSRIDVDTSTNTNINAELIFPFLCVVCP